MRRDKYRNNQEKQSSLPRPRRPDEADGDGDTSDGPMTRVQRKRRAKVADEAGDKIDNDKETDSDNILAIKISHGAYLIVSHLNDR